MRFNLMAATALGTSLAALVPGAASAQGAHPVDWSGFYAGGSIGVIQQGGTNTLTYPAPGTSPSDTSYNFANNALRLGTTVEASGLPTMFSLTGLGGVVGVDAGYNLQSGNFVYGLEGDLSVLNNQKTHSSFASSSGNATVFADDGLSTLMSLRGRVGITADRLLMFATAGIAAGQTSVSTGLNYTDIGKAAADAGSASAFSTGVIAGLGGEYAVTDHLSLRLEGDYYWLNGVTATATQSGAAFSNSGATLQTVQPYTSTYNPSGALVKAGVNFRF